MPRAYLQEFRERVICIARLGELEKSKESRRVWIVAWVTAAAFLSAVMMVLSTPVEFVTEEAGVDASHSWQRVPLAEPSRIEVSSDGGRVVLGLSPTYPEGSVSPKVRAQGFKFLSETGKWVSDGPAVLEVEGVFGDINIVLDGPTESRGVYVERQSGGTFERLFVPAPDGPGWTSRTSESPSALFLRTEPLVFALADTQSSPTGDVRVSIGPASLDGDPSPLDLLQAALWRFVVGTGMVIAAGGLLLFFWLLGSILDVKTRNGPVIEMVRLAGGFAVFALALNSLTFIVSATTALVTIVVLVVGAVFARLRTRPPSLGTKSFHHLARLFLWSLPGVVIAFYPIFTWGQHFVGRFKTDLISYSGAAASLTDMSMLELKVAGANVPQFFPDVGFAWRSIDVVLISSASLIPGISTVGGVTLVAIALYLLFAMSTFALTFQIGSGAWTRVAVTFVLLSPIFSGLFLENYFSQYVLMAVVPPLVLAAGNALRTAATGSIDFFSITVLAALMSAAIAVYPYMALPILLLLIASLLLFQSGRSFVFGQWSRILLLMVALSNVALIQLWLAPATNRFSEGLNAITRNVLIPSFNFVDLFGLFVGTVSYQFRAAPSAPGEWMGQVGGAIWSLSQESMSLKGWTLGPLLLFVMGLCFSVRWAQTARNPDFTSLLLITTGTLAIAFVQMLRGESYQALKLAWSAAAVAPVVVATLIVKPRWRQLFALSLLPLTLLWLRTDVADRASYFLPRAFDGIAFGAEMAEQELAGVRRILTSDLAPVTVVSGLQPLLGTDLDRTLGAHLQISLTEEDVECFECSQPLSLPSLSELAISPACQAEELGVVITVGRTGLGEVCGLPLHYRGRLLEVFRKHQPEVAGG